VGLYRLPLEPGLLFTPFYGTSHKFIIGHGIGYRIV